jgi:hypothetical protein
MMVTPQQIHARATAAPGDAASDRQSSSEAIDRAVARIDAWLDTMRGPDGYGGPVVHWWQQSLLYTGAGLDWRYEGIIAGYLQLWQRSHDERWLMKAMRAGDDLVAGQTENGHYIASAFEINPATAGTPHEAACDVGLLLLAQALQANQHAGWRRYATCAEQNLRTFYIQQLWGAEAQAFRDSPTEPSFVPNKAATACEALFLLSEISHDDQWVERYALPTLDPLSRTRWAAGRSTARLPRIVSGRGGLRSTSRSILRAASRRCCVAIDGPTKNNTSTAR